MDAVRFSDMASLDSEAAFEASAMDLGLNEGHMLIAKAKKWNTFWSFAFSCNYQPGSQDGTPLMAVASTLARVGATPPPDDIATSVRRLFLVSYTFAAASLRAQVERTENDPPRELAAAERSHRIEEQKTRLTEAIRVEGANEVVHALTDKVVATHEENLVKYLKWHESTKRDQETLRRESDPAWKPNNRGVVSERKSQEELEADTSTDPLLRYALARRDLSFDQCRLVSFDKFQLWTVVLLHVFLRTPPQSFTKVSLEQIQSADLALFTELMRMTRSGIIELDDVYKPFPADAGCHGILQKTGMLADGRCLHWREL